MVSLKGEAEMPKFLNFASGRKVLITSFSLISQRERKRGWRGREREGMAGILFKGHTSLKKGHVFPQSSGS